ncbi:YgjP-like metallopeptidase domain-containing protein [Streptomyces sp. NPDC058672]|uniref:YgjP-like metallopeptidase domain-containing protein n=1 Tax=Streptomyces sp. NPDC058672 TaxID=3346591 RepID=UPI003660FB5D
MTYKTERTITVCDITIHVRTSDRTTLDLAVTAAGRVVIRGPHHTTDTQAADLALRRRWIYRQLTHLSETTPTNPVKTLGAGEEFTILGRLHRLQIVPDTEQAEPLHLRQGPGTGYELSMRHGTAENLQKARQKLINFHAKTGQGWLKNIGPQIAAHLTKMGISASFSTRLRTSRAHHHPTHRLTLHWTAIQLDEPLLHELIHRTLHLHTIADTHQLDHALRNLWLGNLTAPAHAEDSDR